MIPLSPSLMSLAFSRSSSSSSSMLVYFFVSLMIGYVLGNNSITLHDVERTITSLLLPLYTCIVVSYITIRFYHLSIEPNFVLSSNQRHYDSSTKSKSIGNETIATASSVHDGGKENETAAAAARNAVQPIDLTGAYKLIQNENFEEFLAAQGVPWALRKAANGARPVHRITHTGNLITIKIEGIIESSTTYHIQGPPVQGLVRGRLFEDTVIYIENGIQTTKRAVEDLYTIQVQRLLSNDKKQIVMKNSVTFDDPKKHKPVACQQIFERIEE